MASRSLPVRPSRPWTLRARLLALVAALLVSVSLVIGVVSVLALDRFLQGRLDDQLGAAVSRSQSAYESELERDDDGGGREGGPLFLVAPGQAEGTLGAIIRDGRVVSAGVLDRGGRLVPLPASQYAALTSLPVDATPASRELGGSLGDYRLVAAQRPDGDVLVTGLSLRPVHDVVYRLAGIVAAVTFAGLAVALLTGASIIRYTLHPLRRVARTAGRVAEMQLDRGDVALAVRVPDADSDPRTEVGRVGLALNRMLGHVAAALTARQESETRVRQFVADASHELRTPLAAIRGYAEVTRRSPERVPPDVAHALQRVESEAERMTGLVDDLLLLARLDEGRPLAQQPVDLSQLVVDATSDAHVAGPDHRWDLDIPDDPVTVTGDPVRLHQVVANLLANARAHTPPGTHVVVSLATEPARSERGDPDDAVLRVIDDGPGIDADHLPGIFERFSRGDASRSRASGSTGLGLAIVAAIVAAHHGTLDVASRPGRTTFTVRFPVSRMDADQSERTVADGLPADDPGPTGEAPDDQPAGPGPGRQDTDRPDGSGDRRGRADVDRAGGP